MSITGGTFAFTDDLNICRLLNGLWQVSGAHGRIDPTAALNSMIEYHDAGFTTWDLADHYGPAEDFIGEFRRRLADERGAAALAGIQAFTKWVPRPGPMSRDVVENNVDISLRRMGVDCLDLLQFHWWEYGDDRYLEALGHLLDRCMDTDGIQLFIGDESGYRVFDDCTVVTARYEVDSGVAGVLGVIGPTRMAYDKVIPMVDVTARMLGAAITGRSAEGS